MAKGKKPHNRVNVQPPGKRTDVAAWQARILDYVSVCRKVGMAAQKPLEGLDDDQLLFLVDNWPDIPELRLNDSRVTDSGLKAALAKTTQLQALAIAEAEGITDQGLEYISHLPNLRELHLYLGFNFTSKGISHLKKLKNLESLSLPRSRNIEAMLDVVAQMRQFKRLKRLRVPDDPQIPWELRGTENAQAILEAWRNGEDFLDFRIAIVGMAGVGKSCLLRRCFLDEVVPSGEMRKINEDIDLIHDRDLKWKPRIEIDKKHFDIASHIWDFGGQLIKHGIHEMFFAENSRTLYVLVLSAIRPLQRDRNENGDESGNGLNYWLKMIKDLAGITAPVLIVVTQCDQSNRNREVDEIIHLTPEDLRRRGGATVIAPVIDGISACDKSPSRIEPLRAAIEEGLRLIRHGRMPKGFRRLRAHVESKLEGKSLVSVEEFRTWCSECDVDDRGHQDTYLRILHELGSLFYFGVTDFESDQRIVSSELNSWTARQRFQTAKRDSCLQINIVNPRWWKVPVYALIGHVDGKPWMTKREIDKVIREAMAGYPKCDEAAHVIRESLVHTELCFFDADSDMYLFPRALRGDDLVATDRWPTAKADFGFCPEAAFHRFLVMLHAQGKVFVNKGRPLRHRWSVIATEPGNESVRVAVVVDPENGTLEFRMDPSSDETGRVVLARHLYGIFKGVCMSGHGPDINEVFGALTQSTDLARVNEAGVAGAGSEPAPRTSGPFNKFRRYVWRGKTFQFDTKQQRATVEYLHSIMNNEIPEATSEEIKETIRSRNDDFQVAKVFRNRVDGSYVEHEAFGTLIQCLPGGWYRLAREDESSPESGSTK